MGVWLMDIIRKKFSKIESIQSFNTNSCSNLRPTSVTWWPNLLAIFYQGSLK